MLRDSDFRRGIAAEEQLERAQRLVARILDLPQGIAEAASVRSRLGDRLLVADTDAQPLLRKPQQLVRRAQHVLRDRPLQSGFYGQEITLRHDRGERLPRVRIVGVG